MQYGIYVQNTTSAGMKNNTLTILLLNFRENQPVN